MATNRSTNYAVILKAAICGIIFASLTGCRFKSPNLEEQQALVERGAFPSGTPGWLASPTGVGNPISGGGFIPTVFAPPSAGSVSGGATAAAERKEAALELAAKQKADAARQSALRGEVKKDSPIGRIESVCPGLESQVTEALTTTALDERLQKYLRLTTRCSNSSDLWLWLGKDYQKKKLLVQASRCFEKSLILDNQNKEAEELLAKTRKELNATPATKLEAPKPKGKRAAPAAP